MMEASNDLQGFEKQFVDYVAQHRLRGEEVPTLLAVSGGVDSVVLAHLFHKMGWAFGMAHCDFGLRAGSAGTRAFVEGLAKRYGVVCHTKCFETKAYARTHGVSVQMAARDLRYRWFEEVLEAHGMEAVATAHHVNDALETFVRHVVKGTGIRGLHGMATRRGRVVRPLLFADKEMIRAYAQGCGLVWEEDPSNADTKYDRNFMRHRVVPLLKVLNPNLETTFGTTLARLQQVDALFQSEAARVRGKVWRTELPYHYIQVETLRGVPWVGILLEAWLAPFGFCFKEVMRWLEVPPQAGKRLYSATHWLLADRGQWVVGVRGEERKADGVDGQEVLRGDVLPGIRQAVYPKEAYVLQDDRRVAALDLHRLSRPWVVRPWQAGDVLYPLTKHKPYRKKVSDLLVDAKVPLHQKGSVNVLLAGGQIAWVIGYQIDDRFKVTEATKEVWEGVWEGGHGDAAAER